MTEPCPTRAVLLADIGGTNSRFALAGPDGRPERIMVVLDDLVADLEEAIAHYLDETGVRPSAAVLAVAAPIDGGDEIALTNRAWRFRRSVLTQRFGLAKLRVVNDFEAIAWALTRLTSADVRPLGRVLPAREGVKAVLGPGTGLGVAALLPVDGRWHVLASEGGHASFGPQMPDEMDVFARLARDYGTVSAETVLSGPGLPRLMRSLDPQSLLLTPEAIVASALAGEPSAQATVQLFVRLLGRFAAGLALTFKAVGGVYIAGGVAASLGTQLDEQVFRAAFEAHPPYEKLLQAIPTLLVSCAEPGLFGCAVLADEFAVASD
jgi:glucokinase